MPFLTQSPSPRSPFIFKRSHEGTHFVGGHGRPSRHHGTVYDYNRLMKVFPGGEVWRAAVAVPTMNEKTFGSLARYPFRLMREDDTGARRAPANQRRAGRKEAGNFLSEEDGG